MKDSDLKSFYKKHYQELSTGLNKGDFDDRVVIISNDLARQNTLITLEEEQLLHCIFSQLNPHKKNSEKVLLKKEDLFKKLGLTSTNRYVETKKKLKGLIEKSMVDFTDKTGTDYVGVVITGFKSHHKSPVFEITLNSLFMPYIQELANHYTRMDLDSIVQFDSKYALTLYKFLASWRSNHYHRAITMTTKELKALFGMTKDDYVKATGKFDRYNFEKYTLEKAIAEINAKVPNWVVSYHKVKRGNRVSGYIIEWMNVSEMETNDNSVSDQQLKLDMEQYFEEVGENDPWEGT